MCYRILHYRKVKFSTLFTNVLHVNNVYTIIIHVPSPTYKKIIWFSKYLSTSFRSSSCKHLLVISFSLFILLLVFPDWIAHKRIGHSEGKMKPTYSTRVKITRVQHQQWTGENHCLHTASSYIVTVWEYTALFP